MRISTDLFDLIKSLSKSEKRYFKVFASMQVKGEQNNYVKLFDAIDAQNEYQEDKLLKKFKGEKFVKQFSVAKNYLYSLVLKSLKAYHSGKSIDSQLSDYLEQIRLLYDKGLYDQCYKIIIRALKLAREHEMHLPIVQLLAWEDEVEHARGNVKQISKFIETGFDDAQNMLRLYSNYLEYRKACVQMFTVIKTKSTFRGEKELDEIKDMLESPYLKDEELAESIYAKHQMFFALSKYYRVMGENETSYLYRKKHYELFKSNPVLIREKQKSFLFVLNNLCAMQFLLEKYEEVEDTIEQIDLIQPRTDRSNVLKVRVVYSCRMSLFFATGRFEEAYHFIDEMKEGLKKYNVQMAVYDKMVFTYYMFYACYGLGKLKEALRYLNQLMNEFDISIMEDVHCIVRVTNLLVHYELGNWEILDNLVKSASRFLKKKDNYFHFESVMLKFFGKKATEINSRQEEVEAFKILRYELGEIDNHLIYFFDFNTWLVSKIKQISFYDAFLKQLKK